MRIASLGLSICLLCCQLFGQGTSSRLVGTVVDSSGAIIPDATVTLVNEGTKATFTTKTTTAGTYVFDAVQVGTYTVEVTAQGFKKFVGRGNAVSIGQPTTVNVSLTLGAVSESVEVSGVAEVVQTDSSGNFGNLFTEKSVQELPIVGTRGRNPIDLINIQPGVEVGANTGGGVHVSGARDRAVNITLDGIDSNETSASGSNFSPTRFNPDMLSELHIITGNATAEFGRNSGAEVAAITRSGSNVIHGEGFYFYRTPRLNANEYNFNLLGLGKSQFVQNIYGGSIGGPIIKNKLFVFANVQALAALNSGTATRTVFTTQARQGILRYVMGGRNRPAGSTGASVDASGNVLPGVNVGTYDVVSNDPQRLGLDKTLQALIAAEPLPNRFDLGDGLNTAGFVFSAGQKERQHDETFKTDYILNSKNTIYFRGSWGSQDTNCDTANGGLPIFPGLPCLVNTVREPRSFAANWRWTPTAHMTNEFVFGQNKFTFNFVQPADITKLSLNNGPVTINAVYDWANARTLNTYQVVDNLSYVRGAHQFKFGINFRLQHHTDIRGSIGGQDSTTNVDFDPTVNTVDPNTFNLPKDLNTAFDQPNFQSNINFLLGRVGSITRGFIAQGDKFVPGILNIESIFPEYDFYAQDTWKVARNFTVDLGLRWEIKLSPSDPQNRTVHPDQPIAIGAAPSDNLKFVQGSLYRSDFHALGPSIGFAWDPFKRGRTSIRGNYRIAYDRMNTFTLSSAIYSNLPGDTLGVVNQDYGQAGGRLAGLQPLAPPNITPSALRSPAAFSPNNITVVDPNFKSPTTHEWGLAVQQQIGQSTVFEADYIGRRAYHLMGAYNINQAQIFNNGFLQAFQTVQAGGDSPLMDKLLAADNRLRTGETGSQLVRRLFASNLSLNSVGALANSIATRLQTTPSGQQSVTSLSGAGLFPIIPYPQFGGGVFVIDSNDFSTYHAAVVQLHHRYHNGLDGQVSYTFSKSLDTRSFDPVFTRVGTGSTQSGSSTPIDIYNRRLNYAPSDFDRTHVLQSYWVYDLPFGKGKRFGGNRGQLFDKLAGGWEISGLLTAESGRPFTVYSGSNTVSSVRQTPANCSSCSNHLGQVLDDPASSQKFYFDATQRGLFTTPGPGDFGNTGRNFFRAPGYFDLDTAFAKNIHVTERYRFQLRADVSNLANHPSFDFPTATITSTTFGRIGGATTSGSRKIQLGAKFYF